MEANDLCRLIIDSLLFQYSQDDDNDNKTNEYLQYRYSIAGKLNDELETAFNSYYTFDYYPNRNEIVLLLEIRSKYILYINSKMYHDIWGNVKSSYTNAFNDVDKIVDDFIKLRDLEIHLCLNKYTPHSEFYDSRDIHAIRELRIIELRTQYFKDPDNYCCVCSDATEVKTQCSHYLCLLCWNKLHSSMKCPLCRKSINKISHSLQNELLI